MKSVLFLIPTLGGGGAERVLVNLVNNLDKEKYSITVQTLFKAGVNAQYLMPHIRFVEGKIKQFSGNTKIMKLFSPQFLYRIIVRKKYNIVVSYLEGPTARICAGCKDVNTKKFCWIHGEQKNSRVASYSFRSRNEATECYNQFDKILCVAETVKADFESIFSLQCPCEVIYNVNEDAKIKELAKESIEGFEFSDSLNLITVGRAVEEKGFDRLIRIHKRLIDEGIVHHIYHVGGGKTEHLKELVSQLQVYETFHFVGFQTNPYKYVSKSDLFVCSSRREGFSTVVTEALILGIPVVSTLVSGAIELLGDKNQFGIITDNTDDALYEGIKKLIQNRELLNYYKHQSLIRGSRFSKKACVESVEDLLQ